jgi:NitT/TauT family transport system substrate-binding protein
MKRFAIFALAAALAWPVRAADKLVLRVGHFPNITHVQALVAQALSRQGKGWFEQRLGPDVALQWFTYNAGPSAMEAILAGSIDLSFVGPSPAINAYARSAGEDIRIISGAANGGTALVVQPDENLKTAADFRGKKIATPQLGNTQALVEEPGVTITVLVSSAPFLERHMEVIRKFVAAEQELTTWIQHHPEEARTLVQGELAAETKGKISAALIAHAWNRIVLTNDVSREGLADFVAKAKAAGFLRQEPDLSKLVVIP